jgi:hypothetical protein
MGNSPVQPAMCPVGNQVDLCPAARERAQAVSGLNTGFNDPRRVLPDGRWITYTSDESADRDLRHAFSDPRGQMAHLASGNWPR